MSSWFDAKHISSFAKTALNEAQKTLDKALDIKEDEGRDVADEGAANAVPDSGSTAAIASSKLWGSFTGSFFDPNEKGTADQARKEKDESDEPSTPANTVTEAPVPSTVAAAGVAAEVILSQPLVSSSESDSMTQSAILEEVDGDDIKDVQEQPKLQDHFHNAQEEQEAADGFSTSQLVIAPDAEDRRGDAEVEDSMASSAGTAVMIESTRDEESAGERDPEALVSTLMHDAMAEEALSERRSETSSSRSFEVVAKSASEITSGDELELETRTTSSDIEVIASPTPQSAPLTGPPSRCGGGGTRRQSHARTGSEISHTGSSTSNGDRTPPQEVDRLTRKLQEMSELLDAREVKVLELSNANFELVEKNTDLGSQVREAMRINAKLNETVLSTEDITQRLSAMEKKLQRAIAEKDSLAAENKKLKGEAKSRVPQSDIDDIMAEKDESIEGLRAEGEALSKQVGKQSEALKKMRAKEKTSEKEMKNLQSELDERKKECERLQKSLAAKDEIEMKQIEAIQSLSNANKSWEDEHLKLKSDSEDNSEKMAAMSRSLEAAYKEVAELKRGMLEKEGEAQELALSKEMAAKQALQDQLREVQEQSLKEREALFRQIDDLRASQSSEGRSSARREEQLLRERDDLLARLEASEKRNEDLSDSVSAATRPLLRQIASLQSSLNEAQASGERVERSLNERLQQASIQLAAAVERERTASEQYRQASGRTAQLESKADALAGDKSRLQAELECEAGKRAASDEKVAKAASALEASKRSCAEEILDLKRERNMAEASLESERAETTSEKRKNLSLAEQLKERDRRMKEMQTELDLARAAARNAASVAGFSRGPSPANSVGRNSVNGSFTEWPEEVFDNASVGRSSAANLYDTLRNQNAGGGGAALVESLQAQLKQREGELVQVQMELGAMERSKANMAAEVNRLSQKVERLDALETDLERLKTAYTETEQKYQTMLTMYGEKVEEAEELRLDLVDVKELYKSQIQELTTQQQNE